MQIENRWRLLFVAAMIMASGMLIIVSFSAASGTTALLETATATPTQLFCPQATLEPFWVEPVHSPTNRHTQTITVGIGNGVAVAVFAESGTFTTTGDFNSYGRPALVDIGLLSNITHHLTVSATVRQVVNRDGCVYGGYSLITTRDRNNNPLQIAQVCVSLSKQATPNRDLRNDEVLTYTLVLAGSGKGLRLWDPLPEHVHYISDSLTGTVMPLAVYSPTARAVAWQGDLLANTVQTISFQVTPGITGSGSLSLSLPIVNTAWLTNTETGGGVSATVIVNGLRVYLPLIARSNEEDHPISR
jgi:hypothetical protein